MIRLAHDSGGPATVKCEQALGPASPLQFDDDGTAWLDDEEAARRLVAIDAHVSVQSRRDSDGGGSDDVATCDVIKSDGEVCGRDLPCAYHSE